MNKKDFKGMTALVTGAGSGLGKAIAQDLAYYGMNIVIHYHSSKEGAELLQKAIKLKGIQGWLLHRDLSHTDSAERLVSEALSLSGKVDFLINSASIYRENTLETVRKEDIIEAVQMNAFAPLTLGRNFKKLCGRGAVINILDARMVDYDRNHIAYSLSKQMLFSLTRMMSREFAPSIRVNAIAPGIITPPEGTTETLLEKMKKATLLNKIGSPEEICNAVRYLLSSSYVTGETIFVDGGRNIHGKMFGL